jgi:type I restriction enzyme M protein
LAQLRHIEWSRHGVLFRAEEQHMRAALIEHDVVECILGLGPNLFYNSPMEACVVVCRMRKPPERQGRILFINAVNDVTRERAQSFLEEAHIQKILRAYQDFRNVEHFAQVVPLEEIHANQDNLNIAYYVRPASGGNGNGSTATDAAPSLTEVIAEWEQSSRALRASMDELFATLDGRDVTIETKC